MKQEEIYGIIGDMVYPNDYAIKQRHDFEDEFNHEPQKVVDCYPTNIDTNKYPHSSHIVEVEINGIRRKYYSSALRKVL